MPTGHRQVLWAPKAKQDLYDVWGYYARVASPEIADRLVREISEAGARLADQALMWRARYEVWPGLRAVMVRPHTVFYRINNEDVEIVRVLHERRNFPDVFRKER